LSMETDGEFQESINPLAGKGEKNMVFLEEG
jgi:hypothetical protein